MGKAALFLATGFEEIEAIGIIDVLRRGGLDLVTISVSGMEDVEGSHGVIVKSDALFFQLTIQNMTYLSYREDRGQKIEKHEGYATCSFKFITKASALRQYVQRRVFLAR